MPLSNRVGRVSPLVVAVAIACHSVVARAEQACVAPSAPTVDVGFSPEGSAEKLVLNAICRARRSIHVSAYAFTSAPIAAALIKARDRGLDVAVVADRQSNLVEDRSGRAIKTLDDLARSGVHVRLIGTYRTHHDKSMVIDGDSVETGSFNFTTYAARFNSENAVVLWHVPLIARAYEQHWASRFNQGRPWQLRASN